MVSAVSWSQRYRAREERQGKHTLLGPVTPVIRRTAAALLLAVVALASTPSIVQSQGGLGGLLNPVISPAHTVVFDWPLIPPGLDTEGTRFRLLAITTVTTGARSREIAPYNTTFQNNVAQQGHSAIRPYADGFKIIGCTREITLRDFDFAMIVNRSARDNTGTHYTFLITGVPIYYLNGDKVADDYADFYDGDWDTTDGWDVRGNSISSDPKIWTGCNDDGYPYTAYELYGVSDLTDDYDIYHLGGTPIFASSHIYYTAIGSKSEGIAHDAWQAYRIVDPNNYERDDPATLSRLFGLSEIFEVGPTPDPLSATISAPATYNGTPFLVEVEFNYPIHTADTARQAGRDFKEHTLNVENGTANIVLARGELGTEFLTTITPDDSYKDVVITLNSSIACGETGAICATVSNSVFTLDETPTHTVRRLRPAIDNLRITSVPNDGVAYRVGESITATVRFDEPIAVVADDAPVLMLEFPGAIKKSATYSGPGTNARELDFTYEVEPGERHTGVGIAANALNTNPVSAFAAGGKSDFHPNSLLSNAVAPNSQTVDGRVRILDVAITSDPGNDLTYHKGDEVEVTVTFDWAVDVFRKREAHFELTLKNPSGSGIADSTVEAPYSDAGSSESDGVLKYRYEVAAGDMGLQGISIPANPLSRNSILVMGSAQNVNYGFAGLATNVLHKVDGSAPASTNTSATGAVTIEGTDMDGTVRVDYTLSADTSGIMDANGMPATDTYEYEWLRSGVLISGAEGSDYTVVDADVGETLSVRLNFTDSAGFSESLRSAETSSVLPAILDHKPSLTIAAASADEADGEITFTVTLGEVHGLEVSVVYVTVGGTAVARDDYRATSGTVTFAPGETEKTITVTILEDQVIEGDEEFAVSLFSPVNAVLGNSRASGTIGDSTAEAVFAAMADSSEIPEAGGNATVTVSIANGVVFDEDIAIYLYYGFSEATRGDDFTASEDSNALRLVAGSSSVSVELDALQDTVYEGDESIVVRVYGIATTSTYTRLTLDTTVTIIDDDELPVATLQLSEDSIAENGGLSTVTATLSDESSTETTITVSAAAVSPAVAVDFTLSDDTTLTIAAGATSSTGTVTIRAVDNGVDAPDKKVTVRGSVASGGLGIAAPGNETLTIVDDEATPTATLILTPDSIGEKRGSSTVTAVLDHPSSAQTTLTVSATAGADTVAGDFTLSANQTLSIAAGATSSTGTVTIRAVNNSVDDPNKEVTVSASAANTQGVDDPADLTLTIEDDEGEPTARLVLTPDSISENGGSSTVTAELSHSSIAETTITVSTAAVEPAVAADFTLSANQTLTIAAGATSSTGTVTIGAVNNGVDAPDRQVTVSADAANTQGVTAPADVTLTIEDDEEAPTVTLQLSPGVIDENGGVSTVTAMLSHASIADTEVTVSELEGVFTLSDNRTLTIAAGDTDSTGTVTITAVDNDLHEPDIYGNRVRSVTVTAVAQNDYGVVGPASVRLGIRDNEEAPTVTLHLSSDSISENGGSATVTATLSHPSVNVAIASVGATKVHPTRDADFELGDNRLLVIAPGKTQSTGTVTIIAINNSVDAPDKKVKVSAQALHLDAPARLTLTIVDDEEAPTVALELARETIYEGESTELTARLSHRSSKRTTVTVSAVYSHGDSTFSDISLSIAAGAKVSDIYDVETADNNRDDPDITQTFSAAAVNSQGLTGQPSDVELTILDNDEPPEVTLHLTPDSIGENGGESTVTAELSHPSGAATTITVSAAAGADTVAGDFALSADTTLSIAAGTTTSTGTVTIAAVNNDADNPDRTVSVTAGAANSVGVVEPSSVTLTIEDDEEAPAVTLHLSPSLIDEDGGESTVTAELSHPSSEATTITVSAAAVEPAVAADFELGADTVLAIAAGATSSTGTVTITAADNDIDAPNKAVTVSAVANNDFGVESPSDVTLFILDNEPRVEVTLELSPSSIAENGGSSTVTAILSGKSSAAVSVTVSAAALSPAVAADFALSADIVLAIAAGATTSTGTVTIDAVDNNLYGPDKVVTVSGSVNEEADVTPPLPVVLGITENESPPQIELSVDPAQVSEDAGSTAVTVTATLDGVALALETAVSVAVGATDDSAGAGTDFETVESFAVSIAAGASSGSATFTLTPLDDSTAESSETISVTGTAAGLQVTGAQLSLVDDEEAPTATLILTPDSIGENEGESTVTATLSHPSSVETTITVSAAAVSPAVAADFELSANKVLTIAADTTTSTGTVTIGAVDNGVDAPDKQVTVSASASNTQGVSGPRT